MIYVEECTEARTRPTARRCHNRHNTGVRSQMVGFGSELGLSSFETTGIVNYFEDLKTVKTQLWAIRCRL